MTQGDAEPTWDPWSVIPPLYNLGVALTRGQVDHGRGNKPALLWENASAVQKLVLQALAREPGRPYRNEYRARHQLPATASVQKALRALEKREVIAGERGEYRIVEPFLPQWLRRQESWLPS